MNARTVLAGIACLFAVTAFAAESTANKAIIPIVGDTIGANNVGFHTEIRLLGKPGSHGRLVFHPAGRVADDANDPSIDYHCAPGGCAELTLGPGFGNGVGSLDVIPDAESDQTLPVAFARIFTDVEGYSSSQIPPSLVPFGSAIREVNAAQWLAEQEAAPAAERFVYIPGGSPAVRRSIAIRTLTPVTLSANVISQPGSERKALRNVTLPADYTLLQPLDQFLNHSLVPSDDVRITLDSGSAIIVYAYTHNYTNEPTVIVAPAKEESQTLSQ